MCGIMTEQKFIQKLIVERCRFHLAHLTALLHTQEDLADQKDFAHLPRLGAGTTASLLQSLNRDLSLLEEAIDGPGRDEEAA